MGADSATTLGVMGQNTIQQSTPAKIEILEGRALLGVSGPVGLAQRLAGETIEALQDNKRLRGKPWQVGAELRSAYAKHINAEWQSAHASAQTLGQAALASAASHSLLALSVRDHGPTLFQFGPNGEPEYATDQLPFVCAGSGMPIADPFMGFLKDQFWTPGVLPSLQDGIFAAYWTLSHAIKLAPGGLALPICICSLKSDGQRFTASQCSDAELGEHAQAVEHALDALRGFRRSETSASPVPLPDSGNPPG